MAADLHALLTAAEIPPPYVLAGHSIGGIVARRFCARHPEAVAGIVLLDSSHENQARRFDAADWRQGTAADIRIMAKRQARILGARRLASSLGLLPDLDADIARELPPEHADAARALLLSTRFRRTAVREMLMKVRLRGTPPRPGPTPLTVLTALRRLDPARLPVWLEMQDELAALSSDSEHVTARNAGHYVHLDDPGLVVRTIVNLVERVAAKEAGA